MCCGVVGGSYQASAYYTKADEAHRLRTHERRSERETVSGAQNEDRRSAERAGENGKECAIIHRPPVKLWKASRASGNPLANR